MLFAYFRTCACSLMSTDGPDSVTGKINKVIFLRTQSLCLPRIWSTLSKSRNNFIITRPSFASRIDVSVHYPCRYGIVFTGWYRKRSKRKPVDDIFTDEREFLWGRTPMVFGKQGVALYIIRKRIYLSVPCARRKDIEYVTGFFFRCTGRRRRQMFRRKWARSRRLFDFGTRRRGIHRFWTFENRPEPLECSRTIFEIILG